MSAATPTRRPLGPRAPSVRMRGPLPPAAVSGCCLRLLSPATVSGCCLRLLPRELLLAYAEALYRPQVVKAVAAHTVDAGAVLNDLFLLRLLRLLVLLMLIFIVLPLLLLRWLRITRLAVHLWRKELLGDRRKAYSVRGYPKAALAKTKLQLC